MKTKSLLLTLTVLAILLGASTTLFGETYTYSQNDLPSRPPTATPEPAPGGFIHLDFDSSLPLSSAPWSVVQWQDNVGNWHDVEGWQGTLNRDLELVWWVAPENLGQGLFRWSVYRDDSKHSLLNISKPFYLPANGHQVVMVELETIEIRFITDSRR